MRSSTDDWHRRQETSTDDRLFRSRSFVGKAERDETSTIRDFGLTNVLDESELLSLGALEVASREVELFERRRWVACALMHNGDCKAVVGLDESDSLRNLIAVLRGFARTGDAMDKKLTVRTCVASVSSKEDINACGMHYSGAVHHDGNRKAPQEVVEDTSCLRRSPVGRIEEVETIRAAVSEHIGKFHHQLLDGFVTNVEVEVNEGGLHALIHWQNVQALAPLGRG